jgi:hypothetical protein
MNYSIIGLIIIIIAWIVQLVLLKRSRELTPLFIIIYSVGVLVLVIDGFVTKLYDLAFLNLASMLVAIAVLVHINLKNKK